MRSNTYSRQSSCLRLGRGFKAAVRAACAFSVALLLGSCSSKADRSEPPLGSAAQALEFGAAPRFTLFESGQVRPLALSPNGKRLYAVNTPDNRLEIFDVKPHGLEHRGSVPVGLEPVAVAVRDNHEVWVVNHLSDSISVVHVQPGHHARVVRTLLVGDEPRDIVFAGPQKQRAFITTAHRGQNIPFDPELLTPGVGRADVWVFDAENLGASLGGTPLTVVTLFTDTPRALAVTPDGSRVYAAGHHTGNRTTMIHEGLVPDGVEEVGGMLNPYTNFEGSRRPESDLIVKYNGTHWVDLRGRVWDHGVKFSLPDKDVFAIDAMANPPAQLAGAAGFYTGVGTILYNMAVNPVNGKVYVTNTEARNDRRFEGPGIFAAETLRGHLHENRITVLGGGSVNPRHLNTHIDYDRCLGVAECTLDPDENAKSLALPQGMAISSDGQTLYVAAFGSSKIGVFDTTALENNTFVPSTSNQIAVSGGGPSGVVLDEAHHRLYVMTRFDNSISIVDTQTKAETAHVAMYNPEPASIVAGRRFLYDAAYTSSHGDSACASCHVFGDLDSLAWDLGNPDGAVVGNPNPIRFIPGIIVPPTEKTFHPMKGPMVTQSLRGMANHGPMHWRGDRTGGYDGESVQPNGGAFDEQAAFKAFNGAFPSLLGRATSLTDAEMDAFTEFALQLMYPPNPIRALDNSLTPDEQAGRNRFFTPGVNRLASCDDCHTLDPDANAEFGELFPGFFGTQGFSIFETLDPQKPQAIKIPHLRNLYQKVGMFGMPRVVRGPITLFRETEFMGEQIRGFGFQHQGAIPDVFTFLTNPAVTQPFAPNGFLPGEAGDPERRRMASFLFAFDSNLAPIVGQQITLTQDNADVAGPRIDLLIARADAGECELIAKAYVQGELGFLYIGSGSFVSNRQGLPPISNAQLRLLPATVHNGELTYSCVPMGSGRRMGLDADLDSHLDGDEVHMGSDPRNPNSKPGRYRE